MPILSSSTRVFRLCRALYAETAFTGEGSWRFSGRWNPAGVRMVYTSSSLALASLELFVHLDPSEAPSDLVVTTASIPGEVEIGRVEIESLPENWRALENPVLQKIGADWVAEGRTAALQVPSVVVEGDWNLLLNPAHPEFARIRRDPPQPWHFDQRLFGRRLGA